MQGEKKFWIGGVTRETPLIHAGLMRTPPTQKIGIGFKIAK